jgi:deoxyribonuclease (pyrimidine dimer)
MTRVNVVPVEELTRQHLQGEYKEITRIFTLAKKAQFDYLKGKYQVPQEYTLGTGHMKFFVPRLKYIADRYLELVQELQSRGYSPNPIAVADLMQGIDNRLYSGYIPTAEALSINRERILIRLAAKG